MRPESIALHHVDRLGENMEACMKAIRWAMVSVAMAALAEHMGLGGSCKADFRAGLGGDDGDQGSRVWSEETGCLGEEAGRLFRSEQLWM